MRGFRPPKPPELINVRHGSYFKLLLKSGLVPEGTRHMRLGTMVLAKDGDMCFSLAEREIDDWMSKNGIVHEKEIPRLEHAMRLGIERVWPSNLCRILRSNESGSIRKESRPETATCARQPD